jgi:hypothetical protein
MFCYISKNCDDKPLISVEAVINLISSPAASKEVKIVRGKDDRHYELSNAVTDEEFAAINIKREKTLGNWNYSILPNK